MGQVAPVRLDISAAHQLGYQPVGDYAATVATELQWLVSLAGADSHGIVPLPPGFNNDYFAPMLNYSAEDGYLTSR